MSDTTVSARLARWLRHERAPAIAAGLGALLALPSLALGEFMDDHLLRERARSGDVAWGHMDTTARGSVAWAREHGDVGWWASESFRLTFMRPLSGLSHRLDYLAWPDQVWLMHAENVVLYALCILVLGRVLRELFAREPLVVGLGCLLFAVDELHAASVAWVAGRNTLLAALFGLVALLAHIRWRKSESERSWAHGLLASLAFAGALLAAEAGLAVFGYILAWSLVRERGWSRVLTLVPYVVLIGAWRGAYLGLDFGTAGSSIYVDPSLDPLAFVGTAIVRAPALSFAALSLPLTDLMTAQPRTVYVLALACVPLAWALVPALRGESEASQSGRVLALGMLAATVPFAATSPSSRTMLILGPGSAGLVALAWAQREALVGRARRALVAFMLGCQLIVGPVVFVPLMFGSVLIEQPSRRLAASVDTPSLAAAQLRVVINAPTEITLLYPRAIRANAGLAPGPPSYVLHVGMAPVTVERVADRSLEVHAAEGWAARHIDRFTRDWAREPLALGERIELEHARVEVLELGSEGRPTRIRVDFSLPFELIEVLAFDGRELSEWRPELGQARTFEAAI